MRKSLRKYCFVDEYTKSMETGFTNDLTFLSLKKNSLISLKKWESLRQNHETTFLKIWKKSNKKKKFLKQILKKKQRRQLRKRNRKGRKAILRHKRKEVKENPKSKRKLQRRTMKKQRRNENQLKDRKILNSCLDLKIISVVIAQQYLVQLSLISVKDLIKKKHAQEFKDFLKGLIQKFMKNVFMV